MREHRYERICQSKPEQQYLFINPSCLTDKNNRVVEIRGNEYEDKYIVLERIEDASPPCAPGALINFYGEHMGSAFARHTKENLGKYNFSRINEGD